ncbi:uncharacterized protein EV422DRAFT_564605 [Fimicolochytrium jonesii]|uniref:uncharacterized protein n=1 Tax=Fimicolochytrium jonesii TaxID=1396493 RepID=UPI0022FE56E1|nr:uncharacterized protein EV422DRAFT_564605 [Fimicolochytrium jonesii]KAI8825274.1 hypothetical protein EV422DRAFT_564605 [Fimicolochytrium jonesii]
MPTLPTLLHLFHCLHLPTTLLLSLQTLLPAAYTHLIPPFVASSLQFWSDLSGDPFLVPVEQQVGWVKTVLVTECVVVAPYLIWAVMKGKDALAWRTPTSATTSSTSTYTAHPLTLVYLSHSATTSLLLTADLLLNPAHAFKAGQRWMAVGAYAPFVVVPVAFIVALSRGAGRERREGKVKRV